MHFITVIFDVRFAIFYGKRTQLFSSCTCLLLAECILISNDHSNFRL